MAQLDERPICPKCGSKTGYVRINGDFVCRECGTVTPKTIR